MGNHFEDVADKKKREAEEAEKKKQEEMKNDPVMQIIETDSKVKEILADPKIQKILEHLRFTGALDLYDVCLLYTSPSPRDRQKSRMPSSA